MNKSECVKVTMRCRPLNKQEMSDGRQVIINISPSRGEILVKSPNNDQEDKAFTFDNVFDWTSTQDGVYNDTAYPIVQSVIEGYNGTIFAYG
jgi:Cdc6-like AAA superfamily ATPase